MTSDIDFVKEIMSSKNNFVKNVRGVEFYIRKSDDRYCTAKTVKYFASTCKGLEDFYDRYKLKGYDKLQIKSIINLDCLNGYEGKHGYMLGLDKRDNFISYSAGMILYIF